MNMNNLKRRYNDTGFLGFMTRRYFIARVYVALSIFITVLSLVFEPTLNHTQATASAADLPAFLFWSAIGVCLVAILDAFGNDFLPDKYTFTIAYQYRHLVYMFLALITFSLSAGLIHVYGPSLLVGRLWLDGVVAALVAVLDLFARHRENSWRSSTS
jgi:hypothetical protein